MFQRKLKIIDIRIVYIFSFQIESKSLSFSSSSVHFLPNSNKKRKKRYPDVKSLSRFIRNSSDLKSKMLLLIYVTS